jgi:hypothetical protein
MVTIFGLLFSLKSRPNNKILASLVTLVLIWWMIVEWRNDAVTQIFAFATVDNTQEFENTTFYHFIPL